MCQERLVLFLFLNLPIQDELDLFSLNDICVVIPYLVYGLSSTFDLEIFEIGC